MNPAFSSAMRESAIQLERAPVPVGVLIAEDADAVDAAAGLGRNVPQRGILQFTAGLESGPDGFAFFRPDVGVDDFRPDSTCGCVRHVSASASLQSSTPRDRTYTSADRRSARPSIHRARRTVPSRLCAGSRFSPGGSAASFRVSSPPSPSRRSAACRWMCGLAGAPATTASKSSGYFVTSTRPWRPPVEQPFQYEYFGPLP